MGWNDRPPNPLDPDADPLLPQADASQPHDIPTGVSPTTAKLQDWTAWLRAHGVFYLTPGVIANDITISGNLTVTGTFQASGATNLGSTLAVGGAITGPSLSVTGAVAAGTNVTATAAVSGATVTASGALSGSYVNVTGTQPASNADPGSNRLHATNMVKAWGAVEFSGGSVSVLDGFSVSNVTTSLGTVGVVTLAHAMANANYAVTISVGGAGHARKYATVQATGKTATVFQFNVWDEVAGAVVDLSDPGTNLVVSFCVMGRQ